MEKKEILAKLNQLINPYTGNLVDFEQVEHEIKYEGKTAIFTYAPLGNDEEKNRDFNRSIVRTLKIDLAIPSVRIVQIPLADEIDEEEEKITGQIIAIMSGKGGVGKSQVTVNLARALNAAGKKVGIIDADIYGYSIPKILDLYGEPNVVNQKIIPLTKENIEVMSTQYFIGENANEAVAWRAPMLNKMMQHLFNDVAWNKNLDYLLIDLPPGTGDVFLNLPNYTEDLKALLVTTPHQDAAHVALRAGKLAKDLKFDLLGVVENMSYYDHNGEKLAIFGQEGANIVAENLASEVICRIPITTNSDEISKALKVVVDKIEE